jgi:signal transduction histidine kinase
VVERVSVAANAPVYGFIDQYLGRGIVGGSLYSFAVQGQEGARLALRILGGTAPSELPVLTPQATTVMFDWRQLQRWGIPELLLPANSEVQFRELTVWDLYQWHVMAVGIALLLQSVLIGVLLHEHRQRRGAEATASKLQSDLAHINRVSTAGELAASIAHEVRQPLAAIVTHGGAGQRWLKNETPNLDEVSIALQKIVSEGHRADAAISNIRAMFSREATPRTLVDVNELVRQVLTLLRQ